MKKVIARFLWLLIRILDLNIKPAWFFECTFKNFIQGLLQ